MTLSLFAAVTTIMCVAAAAGQVCEPRWMPGWGRPGANDEVYALAVFDFDGPGGAPAELVVGGEFTLIGDAFGSSVARWDGTRWMPVGAQRLDVTALEVFDADGPGPQAAQLMAAGWINVGLPNARKTVLAWSGAQWVDVAPEPFLSPSVLHSFDSDGSGPMPPRLVAAGWNVPPYSAVASWDGVRWVQLGDLESWYPSNPSCHVNDLATYDPDIKGPHRPQLIATGEFLRADGAEVNSIAAWDGDHWSAMSSGLHSQYSPPAGSGRVLAVFDFDGSGPDRPRLVVGGSFDRAGSTATTAIAAWDGTLWSSLGSGWINQGAVSGLTTYDEDGAGPQRAVLVVHGTSNIGGNLATFDGSQWSSSILAGVAWIGYHQVTGKLPLMAYKRSGADTPMLVAGAGMRRVDGEALQEVGVRESGEWRTVARGFDRDVTATTAFDLDGPGPGGQELIVSGAFNRTPDGPAIRVASFDGTRWSQVGQGLTVPAYKFKILDTDQGGPLPARLFMFTKAPRRTYVWEGGSWAEAPSPTNGTPDLAVFDFDGLGPEPPRLVAVTPLNTLEWIVVKLTESGWTQVGSRLLLENDYWSSTDIRSLCVVQRSEGPVLLVAGSFDLINGQHGALNAARWNGSDWAPIGDVELFGAPGVWEIAAFDPDGPGPGSSVAILAGPFDCAVWDGAAIFHLSGSMPLTVFDPDGTGPQHEILIAGGRYWDGESERSLNGPTGYLGPHYPPDFLPSATVWRSTPADPGQVVFGGGFEGFGNIASAVIARMSCGLVCYANCDGSTSSPLLTANDFNCFMSRFANGESYANCDGSQGPPLLTAGDFQCFMNAYAAGCP